MVYYKRERCIICGTRSFEHLITFKDFPVYMGVSSNDTVEDDLHADMVWESCSFCQLVQLTNLIDLEILYHKGHNPAIGKMWDDHHKLLAQLARDHAGKNILEIGGGNLKLAHNILADNSTIVSYRVSDANEYGDEEIDKRISFQKGFFGSDNSSAVKYDTVVHSHLLEHIYDPVSFLQDINHTLEINQKMVFAVPDIGVMIRKNYTNSMNFEHTFYLDESLLKVMLEQTGFEVVELQKFNEDILFVVAQKINDFEETSNGDVVTERGKFSYSVNDVKSFLDFHTAVVTNLNKIIDVRSSFYKIYVFGAHIFTQFLIGFGLNTNNITTVLDNDKNKIGHRLYGTTLNVESPRVLRSKSKSIVLLRAAQYNGEITEDIHTNINPNVVILSGEED